jgi:hypothetical protein
MKYIWLLILNAALTYLFCFLLGPAAFKLEKYFGLIGWSGRTPFYLMHFYIGVGVYLFRYKRNWVLVGVLAGLAMGLPLAFWTYATKCPTVVPFIRVAFTLTHGLIAAFAIRKLLPI